MDHISYPLTITKRVNCFCEKVEIDGVENEVKKTTSSFFRSHLVNLSIDSLETMLRLARPLTLATRSVTVQRGLATSTAAPRLSTLALPLLLRQQRAAIVGQSYTLGGNSKRWSSTMEPVGESNLSSKSRGRKKIRRAIRDLGY